MTPARVLRPADPLDVLEARRLVREVEGLPPDARVQVDVSAVRDVHPAGLAYLAYALAGDERVTLRGLNRRHERLLAYLLEEGVREAVQVTAAGTAASRSPS